MLKELLRQVGQYKRAAILTPVFTSLEVVMGVLIPYVTAWMIDRGINAGNLHNVCMYGLLMVVMAFFSLGFGIAAGRFSAYASSGFAANLRRAMYSNIQTFSFGNIDKFSTAGLVTRMTTDVSNLQNAFQMILRISVRAPLNLLFSVLMCFVISPRLSIIFVVALVVLGTALYLIMSRSTRLFARVFERYDELNGVVQENVSAIRVVKSFVSEEHENKKFDAAADKLYRLFVKTENLMALNHPVMNFVVYGCIISLSWFGAQLVVGGSLSTGQLTSLFVYVMNILNSLMMLSMIFVMITMSTASGKRVAEVLREEADITNPADPVRTVTDGSIDFHSVNFSYSSAPSFSKEETRSSLAIRNVSLHINTGETIGIIGGTGCGKSTLAALVSRLYDVTAGSVSVGGTDVRRYDLDTLRGSIATVMQADTLFAGSVIDNLRWGNPEATPDDCREACQLADAAEFVERMEGGYEARLEQNAANLSGGQKQRLCIARALLKRPRVLILDDSTSACDTATDARIRHNLRQALPGTTKLIIAQRIQSVQDADRIIVMQSGRIVGFDTHEHLLQTNRLYQEIYETQTQTNGDFDRPI